MELGLFKMKSMTLTSQKTSEQDFNLITDIIDKQPWIKHYENQLNTLIDFCDDNEQKNLISLLLKNFFYFNEEKEREACIILDKAIQTWGLKPENSWVVAVADSGEVDGSTAGLQKLKNKIKPLEDWHSRFIPSITKSVSKINEGENVILFDDFVGTGKKIVKKEKWLRETIIQKGLDITTINFYIIGFSGMDFGIKHINTQTPTPICITFKLKKGISDNFHSSQKENYLSLMRSIESKLAKKYKNKKLRDYSLGYCQSETLYCGANDNCPNNVFPVFWWPCLLNGKKHETILTRAG